MAHATFFGEPDSLGCEQAEFVASALQRACKLSPTEACFDMDRTYHYQDKLYGVEGRAPS
jgi:hypothetical protein